MSKGKWQENDKWQKTNDKWHFPNSERLFKPIIAEGKNSIISVTKILFFFQINKLTKKKYHHNWCPQKFVVSFQKLLNAWKLQDPRLFIFGAHQDLPRAKKNQTRTWIKQRPPKDHLILVQNWTDCIFLIFFDESLSETFFSR